MRSKRWRKILCGFGWHRLRLDREEINGVWWAFCVDCGARYEQLYDMTYGHTYFRPR